MIEIRPIMQGGIDLVWPLLKEGLDKIEKKGMSEEPQELIRQCLKTSPYMMAYLLYSGKEYVGFFIGRIDARLHHQEFCIYKAFKLNGHEHDGAMKKIKEIAKANKCKYITFYSSRRGWKRSAAKEGFKEGYTQYIQEA